MRLNTHDALVGPTGFSNFLEIGDFSKKFIFLENEQRDLYFLWAFLRLLVTGLPLGGGLIKRELLVRYFFDTLSACHVGRPG